jgi:phospholipid/cholesterol/gamma-HCH transport system substrate-binding protein
MSAVPPVVEPPRAKSQRRQIAALLILALLLAITLAGGIAYQHGVLTTRSQVYFLADDATGLSPGTPVRMSGFRIGKIAAMHLQPDLSVKVVLAIETEPFSHLKTDARAEVVREQLRPAAIDLRPGSAEQSLSEDDPHVGFRKRGTLTEIAEDLRTRLAPILDDVKQLTGTARARKGDIDAMLEHAHAVTRELAGATQEMHALTLDLRNRVARLGTQGESVLGEANRSVVRLGNLIGQADKSLDAVNTRLPGHAGQGRQRVDQPRRRAARCAHDLVVCRQGRAGADAEHRAADRRFPRDDAGAARVVAAALDVACAAPGRVADRQP